MENDMARTLPTRLSWYQLIVMQNNDQFWNLWSSSTARYFILAVNMYLANLPYGKISFQ